MVRWLGLVAAGVALLFSPLLARSGTGQAPPELPAAGAFDSLTGPPAAPLAGLPAAPIGGLPPAAQVSVGQAPPVVGMPAMMGGAAAGEMMGFGRPTADGGQLLTLIDTARQWMAVYHIEGSGRIRLIGSRPLSQDFAVQYNAAAPLPAEMRQLGGG